MAAQVSKIKRVFSNFFNICWIKLTKPQLRYNTLTIYDQKMCGAQLTTKSSNALLGLKLVKLRRLTINHDYAQTNHRGVNLIVREQ